MVVHPDKPVIVACEACFGQPFGWTSGGHQYCLVAGYRLVAREFDARRSNACDSCAEAKVDVACLQGAHHLCPCRRVVTGQQHVVGLNQREAE